MKTTFTLFVFVCLTFHVFGQYARSIYSNDSQAKRHSSLYSINGETTILSIRESANNTLRVMLIDIDDKGETDNYRIYEYSPFNVSPAFALSGIGVNSSGEVTMCILSHNASNSLDVNYVKIDPNSGIFSNAHEILGLYKKGFSRSRVKGDSLITYLGNASTTGISRIAHSLSNTGTSTELAISNETYTGTLFQNNVSCELVLAGSDEFVGTSSVLLKRSGVNNYINTSYPGVLYAPNLAINSSNELFTLDKGSGDYQLFDGNLNSIASGNIPELQAPFSTLSEIYALPNNEFRIWGNRSTLPSVMDISSSYAVINQKPTRHIPFDQVILNGKQYVVGYEQNHASFIDIDGVPFQNSATNITIVEDDLSANISDFIEYDQLISTDKIQFHTNHLSRSFTNSESANAGLSFEQNGLFRSLVYGAASNILGTTINGALVGSTNTYTPTIASGPYCDPGSYDLAVMDKYNRGYYVTREMIEMHLFEITTGNLAYEMPFGIKEWPAHGNVSLGQAADLASFYDQNNNGMYEPELGDYPLIYGDQCLLNVYHQHPNTANSASIETHQYYFTFDCDSSEAIENAVFVRTHNFARGQSLYDTYEGDYIDFDIGNASDDYAGTNVELGMIYAYNGDQYDEANGGNNGFLDTIPAVGMMTLQGLKLDEDGADNFTTQPLGSIPSNGIGFNDGIIDNEFYTLEASYSFDQSGGIAPNLISWSAIMQGYDEFGSPKTVNGVDVRHDYFGSSDPLFYTSNGVDHGNNHSESGLSNPVGDRRLMAASGPTTFTTSDTMVLLKAYIVGVDSVNISVDSSLARLFENGQEIRDLFTQNSTFCGNTFGNYVSPSTLAVEEEKIEQIMAYPNPANQHIQFRGIIGQANLTIIDLNGRIVLTRQAIDDNNSIDISSLEKAIYLIKISDINGSQTIRMIKQ